MLARCLALCLAAVAAAGAQAPSFGPDGLVNAASGQAVFAPYSICSIYGTDLFLNGTAAATGATEVPDTLAGVWVLIGLYRTGIFYLSANQINLLLPNALTPGTYSMRVVRDGLASHAVPIVIQEVAPALFAATPGFAAAIHADGSAVTANSPAIPGEVVAFYATGLGRTLDDPPDRSIAARASPIVHAADLQVLFDSVAIDPSRVQYAGVAPGNAGLYQVNVRLPDDLPPTNPDVQLSIAGSLSPPGTKLITSQPAAPSQ